MRQSEINNCGIFIHVKVRACTFVSYVDAVPHGAQDFRRIFFKTSLLLMIIKFLIQLLLHFRNSQEFKYIKILFLLPQCTFTLILYMFFQSCHSVVYMNIKFSWNIHMCFLPSSIFIYFNSTQIGMLPSF